MSLFSKMKKIYPRLSPTDLPIPEAKKSSGIVPTKPIVITASGKIDLLEKNVKNTFDSIRKKQSTSHALCKAYIDILRQVEFLGFDFLLCEYINNSCSTSDIQNYLVGMMQSRIDSTGFSKEDISVMSANFNGLIEKLRSKATRLSSLDTKQIDISKKDVDLDQFLNQIAAEQKKLAKSLNDKLGKDRKKLNNLLDEIFDFRLVEPMSTDAIEKFKNWLLSELNINENEFQFQNLRILVSRAAYRISTLKQLQERITNMKGLIVNHTKKDSSFCEPSALKNSPFFQSLTKQSSFLRESLVYQAREVDMVNEFNKILDALNKTFTQYQEHCTKTLEDIDKHVEWLQNIFNNRSQEAEKLREEMSPRIKTLVDEMRFYGEDKPDNKINELMREVAKMPPPTNSPLASSWASFQTKLTREFAPVFDSTESNYRNVIGQLNYIAASDTNIFNMSATANDQIMIQKLSQNEADALINYEKGLYDINESLKSSDTKELIDNFDHIRDNIRKVSEEHKKRAQTVAKNDEKAESKIKGKEAQVIDQLKEEIAALREEATTLSHQLGEQSAELDILTEEKFAIKAGKVKIEKSCASPSNIAQAGSINKYLNWVMCPICKANQRDVIISSCGHPFCRKCLEKKRTCPICSKRFSEQDLKKLILK